MRFATVCDKLAGFRDNDEDLSKPNSEYKACTTKQKVLLTSRLDCLGERRDDFHEIADNAVVGGFEDGRAGVFVDGYHALRAFDADQVLNSSGDAQC